MNTIRHFALARIASLVAFAGVAAGCTHEKDLSPPPINQSAKELLQVSIEADSTSHYSAKVVAQYGNMSADCGYLDYGKALGGALILPKADMSIPQVGDMFPIYLDRYVEREVCAWKLMGVGIDVMSPNGRVAFSGLSSRDLRVGARKEVICNFSRPDVNSCLLASLYPHSPGVKVTISVR